MSGVIGHQQQACQVLRTTSGYAYSGSGQIGYCACCTVSWLYHGLQVATLVRADWLFLLTDVDSLYTANPASHPEAVPIPEVHDITKLQVRQFLPCMLLMAHMTVPLGLIGVNTCPQFYTSAYHPEQSWLAADPNESIQSRQLSGKKMVMLMKCLMETFGQDVQNI